MCPAEKPRCDLRFQAFVVFRVHQQSSYLGGGDTGAPLRPRPFEPTDHDAIHKALEMYAGDGEHGAWSMVRREPCGRLQLDKCNCVCSGDCAFLTFKEHGTLLARDKPLACYAE